MKHLATPLLAVALLSLAQTPTVALDHPRSDMRLGLQVWRTRPMKRWWLAETLFQVTRMSVEQAADFSLSETFGIELGGTIGSEAGWP